MKTLRTFALTILCVGLFASAASAMSTNCDGGEPTPPTAEQNLQDILDDLVVSGPPIDASTPSPFELFVAGSTGITAQVIASTDGLVFGIYDGDDPNNYATLLVSGSPTTRISTVAFSDDGTITLSNKAASTRSGFDGPFGFFVKMADDDGFVFIFTEDALNGGAQRALAFQGNGQTTIQLPGLSAGIFRADQFILAFDADGDGVFGDMVVALAGVVPVPEPTSALLIGISLVALLRLRRS